MIRVVVEICALRIHRLIQDTSPDEKDVDAEQNTNYVPVTFRRRRFVMIRALVEEAAAITSVALFVAMIVVWAHVFAVL